MKLIENKGRFSVTIPTDMIAKKGWKKGQRLLLNFNERGHIEIEPLND